MHSWGDGGWEGGRNLCEGHGPTGKITGKHHSLIITFKSNLFKFFFSEISQIQVFVLKTFNASFKFTGLKVNSGKTQVCK